MKSKGNGNADVCVQNLCSIVRGEVFFDRLKGIDGALIERRTIDSKLKSDVRWLIKTYEPRVNVEDIEIVDNSDSENIGNFRINVVIKKSGD